MTGSLTKSDRFSSLGTSSSTRPKSSYNAPKSDTKLTSSGLQNNLLGPSRSGLTGSFGLSSNLTSSLTTSSTLSSRLGQSSALSNSKLGSSGLSGNLGLKADTSKLGLLRNPDLGLTARQNNFGSSSLNENLQSNLLKSSSPLVTIKIEPVADTSYGTGASNFLTTNSNLTRQRQFSSGSDKKESAKRKTGDHSTMKSRKKLLGNDGRVTAISRYEVKPPQYRLEVDIKDIGIDIPDFVSPAQDPSLKPIPKPLHDINGMKVSMGESKLKQPFLICQFHTCNEDFLLRVLEKKKILSVIWTDNLEIFIILNNFYQSKFFSTENQITNSIS